MTALLLLLFCAPQGGSIPQSQPTLAGPVTRRAGEPVINELVASNLSTLSDEDGTFPDWLELRNAGRLPIDLEGWYLTDDPANLSKWRFPATVVAPAGHLIVFASDKDRAVAGQELHTNFKLKASGEFLALVEPNGVTLASAIVPGFPALATDQAYGAPGDSGALALLNIHTPGFANSGVKLPPVTLSQLAGLYTGPLELALNAALPAGTELRYTLDGSAPANDSLLYVDPLLLATTARVRARAVDPSSGPLGLGPIAEGNFTLLEPEVLGLTSTLPLVVVDTFGAEILNDGPFTDSTATFVDRAAGVAALAGPSDYHGRMAIRIRGSSSTTETFVKRSYRAELQDTNGNDLPANLFGLGAESDWVLYAPGRMDRNMISNPFLYSVSETLGLDAMETQFCEMYVNRDGGTVGPEDYEGIYVLIESIKISPERINLAKLNPADVLEPAVTGGYIFSVDRADDDEHAFFTSFGFPAPPATLNIVKPTLAGLVPEQIAWVEQHFGDFEAALYGPYFTDPVAGYPAYIDEPSWIDMHILRTLAMDPDSMTFSNFFYQDRGGKFVHAPLWDVDRTMESDDVRDDFAGTLFSRTDRFAWEWWGRLFEDAGFRGAYAARWFAHRKDQLSNAELFSWIDGYQAEIAEAYPREDLRWGADPNYGSRFGDLQGEIDYLKLWLSERLATLDAFFATFALENVALNKPVLQSSTDGENASDRGCDGKRNAMAVTGSVIATLPEPQPWWEVDLGRSYAIEAIRLSNRWPGEPDVARNFHIFVSEAAFTTSDVALTRAQAGVTDLAFPGLADRLVVLPVQAPGRYVRIQLEPEFDAQSQPILRSLSFAELEVLETPGL